MKWQAAYNVGQQMPTPTLVPSLRGGLGDFFTGLTLPLRSLGMVFGSAKIFSLSLLASIVTAAALIGIWVFAWRVSAGWVGEGTLGGVLHVLLSVLIWIPSALVVPSLALAPLQDPISEATEARCGNFTAPKFSIARTVRSSGVSIAHTASRLAILLAGYLVLIPLNFVAGIGSGAYFVLSTIWASWWLCAEYVSGPSARHLKSFGVTIAAMRRHTLASLGFGLSLFVVLWVPVLNFFLVPVAIVGGTLLFRALHIEGPGRPD
jgi:CysZ protein